MKLSCSVPKDKCPQSLLDTLALMHVKPIITSQVVRVVYDGDNEALGDVLAFLFEQAGSTDMTVIKSVKGVKKHEKARMLSSD